jgi:hypothetical protein
MDRLPNLVFYSPASNPDYTVLKMSA